MRNWSAYLSLGLRWSLLLLISQLSLLGVSGQNCAEDPAAHIKRTYNLRQNTECVINFTVLYSVPSGDGTTYTMADGLSEARGQLTLCARMRNPSSNQRVVFDPSTLRLQGWRWQNPNSNLIILSHNQTVTLDFVLTADSPTLLTINFGRGKEGDIAPENWRQPQTFQTPVMSIVGLESEEDRFWARNNDTYAGLDAYIEQYTNGKYQVEALTKMSQILQNDYSRWVEPAVSLTDVDRFLAKYEPFASYDDVRKNLASANEIRLALDVPEVPEPVEPPPPTEAELELEAFNLARASGDTSRILSYLGQYGGRSARHYQAAQDSLLSWRTPYYEIVGESNNWTEYRLFNFGEPAYRDIYAHRLEIDDDRLQAEGIIRLRPLRQGELAIEIVDRRFSGKHLRIEVDNPMQAVMRYDSTSEQFTVVFERGTKPYRLVLIDSESRLPVWTKDNIHTDEIRFDQAELRQAGLEGEFLTQAYGLGASRPLAVRNGAFMLAALPQANWLVPALLALGFLLLAVLLILLIRNRKRRPPTIFDEA